MEDGGVCSVVVPHCQGTSALLSELFVADTHVETHHVNKVNRPPEERRPSWGRWVPSWEGRNTQDHLWHPVHRVPALWAGLEMRVWIQH